MNAICPRCGASWSASWEEANSPNRLCQACYWNLEPGDIVVCVHVEPGERFLIKGWTYTVTSVQKGEGLNWITVYGSDSPFLLWQFRFCHKPGDTDLCSGM
jgi:hypothetical protein